MSGRESDVVGDKVAVASQANNATLEKVQKALAEFNKAYDERYYTDRFWEAHEKLFNTLVELKVIFLDWYDDEGMRVYYKGSEWYVSTSKIEKIKKGEVRKR
jgi:hypothetical protein